MRSTFIEILQPHNVLMFNSVWKNNMMLSLWHCFYTYHKVPHTFNPNNIQKTPTSMAILLLCSRLRDESWRLIKIHMWITFAAQRSHSPDSDPSSVSFSHTSWRNFFPSSSPSPCKPLRMPHCSLTHKHILKIHYWWCLHWLLWNNTQSLLW